MAEPQSKNKHQIKNTFYLLAGGAQARPVGNLISKFQFVVLFLVC